MCCIFTVCGWVIDLVQRLWTFTMACCISSAVCCSIVVACMSGIALGYNYSLAEYIDLKETNVSVYLKRGVFDDEIADDMEWRRSGPHQPLAGALGDNGGNMITPEVAGDEMPLRSGRRLDDSIFESDDHHRFEGSLMKLTQKPVYSSTNPPVATKMDIYKAVAAEDASRKPLGSLNQLKEIQAMINRRKMDALERTTSRGETPMSTDPIESDPNALVNFPEAAPMGPNGRRMMYVPAERGPLSIVGRPRQAVPYRYDNRHGVPFIDSMSPQERFTLSDKQIMATYPTPLAPRRGLNPIPESFLTLPGFSTKTYPPLPPTTTAAPLSKLSLDELPDEKIVLPPPARNSDNIESEFKNAISKSGGIIEEYEDDIKGLPVRKRRSAIQTSSTLLNKIVTLTPRAENIAESSTMKRNIASSTFSEQNNEKIQSNTIIELIGRSVSNIFLTKLRRSSSLFGVKES